MKAFTGLNAATNSFTTAPIRTDDYHEAISYDPNGNIKTYERNGTSAGSNLLAMDKLTYQYEKVSNGQLKSNRLRYVHDQIPDGNYTDDINSQKPSTFTLADVTSDVSPSLAGDNYGYDAIGNLIKDTKEGITNIEWTVYGKISKIIKSNATIYYNYDAAGNRISKVVSAAGINKTTYYVRDTSGNVISVYTHELTPSNNTTTAPLSQTELHLYGSSRLGVYNVKVDVQNCLNSQEPVTIFTRANKFFELSNHLGNVLVTISDKKLQHTANSSTVDYYVADVVTANDYYPFGMQMPGRKFVQAGGDGYRYGFNGKETDNDVKGEGNQQDYGARIYDTRMGRFLSVDPLDKEYPELTPYQFASNNSITFIDRDGEEAAFRMPNGTTYVQPPSDHMIVPIPQYVKDNGVFIGPNKFIPTIGDRITSVALDFVPYFGEVKMASEFGLGMDVVTGETSPRLLSLPLIKEARNLNKLAKAEQELEKIAKVQKAVTKSEKVVAETENAIVKTPRIKTSAQLRKEWEVAEKNAWPKEPGDVTKNQHAHHKEPLADGGKDGYPNIEPLPAKDHRQLHKERGDHKRWGARAKKEN